MTEYRYFKTHPDSERDLGHLPANRVLVGCRMGYPYDDQYNIYRYPLNTTVFMGLMFASHSTYDAARDGDYYEGRDA